MNTLALLAATIGALWVVRTAVNYLRAVQSINNHPGLRTVFDIRGLSSLIPFKIPFFTIGYHATWKRKYEWFDEYGSDIVSFIGAIPESPGTMANYIVADPAVIKEIVASRQRFPKPVHLYQGLLFWGGNIVASEHDEWKRYRKVAGPSFSEPNNRLVWDETVSIMTDLFENVWGDKKEVVYEHALDLTMPLALFVIGTAGFGRRMTWTEELAPAGLKKGQLSFKDTLHTVSDGMITKVLVPKWAAPYKKRWREVFFAYDELERHMTEMIESRRTAEEKVERHDLLSSLLDANDEEANSSAKLTAQELLSNIYIFLIAGHETTAHSLCFGLGLLALYQDEQERAYQEIKKTIPDGRKPTIQDLPSLAFVEGVMNETLRMYPPVLSVPKMSAEDTTLTTTNAAGEPVVVPVPKGTAVNLHSIALHYNHKYWKDPHRFNPGRFLEDWPRDAFLPFSGGMRQCIGRRFAELESMVAITMILQKYKITVKDDPKFAGETFEQKKERVLETKEGLTLTPVRVPLVFTRRD